jgi:hypothetical protein
MEESIMNKQEFLNLSMRGEQTISDELYNTIESRYMSDNNYHKENNPKGIYETKQEFAKRVFGGKVNTPKTILKKIIAEAIKENRFFLWDTDEATLKQYDEKLTEFYTSISKM